MDCDAFAVAMNYVTIDNYLSGETGIEILNQTNFTAEKGKWIILVSFGCKSDVDQWIS